VGQGEVFDLVAANPPYVVAAVIETLAPEVREHDPRLALDGGLDGLDAYRAIARGLVPHLAPAGTALFEIGHDQGWPVSRLFAAAGFGAVDVEPDLAGLDRMVVVRHMRDAKPDLAAPAVDGEN
jgi:release factor glutamine methyltransferase